MTDNHLAASDGAKPSASGLAFMLRALKHRNYQLFFSGQSVSLIGTWMTRIAMSWLVYRLTGSALLLGVVGFAGQIPSFILAPFAGVLVDRWNRQRLLITTQVLALLQSLALAILALSGLIKIWHILFLSVLQGLIKTIKGRHMTGVFRHFGVFGESRVKVYPVFVSNLSTLPLCESASTAALISSREAVT